MTTTDVAALGPLFVTSTVNTTVEPTSGLALLILLATTKSTKADGVVFIVDELLVVTGSV